MSVRGLEEPGENEEDVDDEFLREARMPFGKYRGVEVRWIAENDLRYLEWVYENVDFDNKKLYRVVEYWIEHE